MKATKYLTVTLTGDSKVFGPELTALEQQLQEANAGDQFKVNLIGPDGLSIDASLAIYEIIMARPAGVHLHTHSHSWLENAEILVWLAGSTRTLRAGAWIHFQNYSSLFKEKKEPKDWPAIQINYARVERLVKKHLPLYLLNRRVWAGELTEWDVINPLPPQIKRQIENKNGCDKYFTDDKKRSNAKTDQRLTG